MKSWLNKLIDQLRRNRTGLVLLKLSFIRETEREPQKSCSNAVPTCPLCGVVPIKLDCTQQVVSLCDGDQEHSDALGENRRRSKTPTAGGRASGERLCQVCRVREGTIVIETVGSIPDNNMVVCAKCAEEYEKFI